MNKHSIQVHQINLVPVTRKWVIGCIQNVLEGEKFVGNRSLSVVFVDDPTIRDLNVRFLQHDWSTDVVAFQLEECSRDNWGEIYISGDRAKEQAKTYRVSLKNELTRLIIHGTLHLLGYQDDSPEKKSAMKNKEDFYLNKFL